MKKDLTARFETWAPLLAGPITGLLKTLPRRSTRAAALPLLAGAAGAGVLAGVAIGVLFAPHAGSATRAQLASQVSSLRHSLTSKLGERAPDGAFSSAEPEEGAREATQRTRAASENGSMRRAPKAGRA